MIHIVKSNCAIIYVLRFHAVDFRNFIVFFGPRPWHIEIRHRVNKTSTIKLFGFETLNLKIRRLKLWKPTVEAQHVDYRTIILTIISYNYRLGPKKHDEIMETDRGRRSRSCRAARAGSPTPTVRTSWIRRLPPAII